MPSVVKITTEDFIKRAMTVHGDLYDYSKTVYIKGHTKSIIICKEHGEFLQSPAKHLLGRGCPVCAIEKRKKTLIKQYGVDNPMKSQSIRKKAQATVRERYGVDFIGQSDIVKSKAKNTFLKKYGVDNPMKNEDIKIKAQQNRTEIVDESSVLKKRKQTMLNKYGVEYAMQSSEFLDKTIMIKKVNGTLTTSNLEIIVKEKLIEIFGKDDVEYQYKSKKYPFLCDFYIKSRDLYIELNACWTHGHKWYGNDNDILSDWLKKSEYSNYYKKAIQIWTDYDVSKRNCAKNNNLNYVVFWSKNLTDFELWLAMNCPDGKDYLYEYSWIYGNY